MLLGSGVQDWLLAPQTMCLIASQENGEEG